MSGRLHSRFRAAERRDELAAVVSDRRYSQSLGRGLAILPLFTPERPLMGVAEIAEELGLSRAVTHRYMTTLAALGFLEHGARRKYQLGPRVTDLGLRALGSSDLREHARSHLLELYARTFHAVWLGVLDAGQVLCVDCVQNPCGPQRARCGAGSRLPVHCTAIGKLLLANLPEPEQNQMIRTMKLARYGPNTIISKARLRQELDEIKHAGIATTHQELAPELLAIAAPVRNADQQVIAAVSISIHSPELSLEEMADTFGPLLLEATERINRALRGQP